MGRHVCAYCYKRGHQDRTCPEVIGSAGNLTRDGRYRARVRERGLCVKCRVPSETRRCRACQDKRNARDRAKRRARGLYGPGPGSRERGPIVSPTKEQS